ncbi:ExbD/TolR family protein [Candidatus Methylomirabilis limnetica]|uniref:ExbD/TolR family protein n=1 Tax=Candidatus Methylomirabilis limnetica TaxID=2033718 RepID=UPI001EFE5EDA|nr:biopolymer transporter ExbD [Candidatus Methylomirabilis limnetica]
MGMQTNSGKDRRLLSEINITPLVDVTLVLLIIFMVTTPMLQRGTDVQLPTAQASQVKEEERITLTVTRDSRILVNNEEVPRKDLETRLKSMTGSGKERVLYLRGDARVPYGFVIDVMDAIKSSGIETVGMITERAESR